MRFSKKDIYKSKQLFSKSKSVAIVPHSNADGDAIGSSVALCELLNRVGYSAVIVSPNNFPDNLKWVKGANDIVIAEDNMPKAESIIESCDLIILLDLNQYQRLGNLSDYIEACEKPSIMIDHHPNPATIADVMLYDTKSSSTAELILSFVEDSGFSSYMTKDIAESILMGIITDTGNFSHNCSNPELYRVVSELIKYGVDKNYIHSKIFNQNTLDKVKLAGYLINNKMEYISEYNTAITAISKEEMEVFNFDKGYLDGVVNTPLTIENTIFSILISESDDFVKISLRSVIDFPANKIASDLFNGGGHKNAAGAKYEGTIEETINLIKLELPNYKKEFESALLTLKG